MSRQSHVCSGDCPVLHPADVRASVGMFGGKNKNFSVLAVLLIAAALLIPGSVTLANQNAMDDAADDYYLVTFSKLPTDSVRAELELSCGISFLEYHQDGTYMIRSPATRVAQISSLKEVTGIVRYSPGQKIRSRAAQADRNTGPARGPPFWKRHPNSGRTHRGFRGLRHQDQLGCCRLSVLRH